MILAELQEIVDTWVRRNGGYWKPFEILARLTEEVGEVAGALQRQEGLRPRKSEVDLPGEVGDLLFTLAVFANRTGVNLEEAFEKTIEKYNLRDAEAWQEQTRD